MHGLRFWEFTDLLDDYVHPLYPKGDDETVWVLNEDGPQAVTKPRKVIVPLFEEFPAEEQLEAFRREVERHDLRVARIVRPRRTGFVAFKDLPPRLTR